MVLPLNRHHAHMARAAPAPDEAVTDEAVTDGAGTEEAVTDEAVAEEAVTDEAVAETPLRRHAVDVVGERQESELVLLKLRQQVACLRWW